MRSKEYEENKPSLTRWMEIPDKLVGRGKGGKHYWLTPPEIFGALDGEFHFDYDPCPCPRPDTYDGLTGEWGNSNFVNPPFRKNMNRWIHKGIAEHRKGKTVVFMIPTMSYMALLIRENAEFRSLGRMPFLAVEDKSVQPGPMEIILAILNDKGEK